MKPAMKVAEVTRAHVRGLFNAKKRNAPIAANRTLEVLRKMWHRGKGQQKVTVEHVHVHSGGQAVGMVTPAVANEARKMTLPDAKQVANAPESPLRSTSED